MSGRDLRTFVNFHRNAIGASDPSLVSRLADGRTTGRYKEVDYGKLKAITKLKNAAGQQSLQKIKSIHHLSKEKKELNILQQHKTCWKKELIRLNSLYKSKLYELDMVRAGFPWEQSSVKDFFIEVEEYEDFMNEDFLTFSKNTVKPLWDLQEDISAWLQEYKGNSDPHEVSTVLESVKLQQRQIMEHLEEEQAELENDLALVRLHHAVHDEEYPRVIPGIPEEALSLTCPYDDLKSLVLNEFELLDKRYKTHLDYLNVKYSEILEMKDEGWERDNHLRFQHILEQYAADMPNRRSLYVDRMLREMPHLTRHDIVEHEKWWFSHKSYQNQQAAIYTAWENNRRDLLLKIKVTFADAWVEFENEKKREDSRKRQVEMCSKLHEKVAAFQRQKLEAFRLQQEIDERTRRQEYERSKMEEEKEKKRREMIHNKIKNYQEKKMEDEAEKLEKERQRLAAMERVLKEQAVKDAERVAYRENELKKRQDEKHLLQQRVLEEQEERERKLEKLREQVCVNVPADPLRVLQSTEASRAHVIKKDDLAEPEELELQKPLFAINTFTTKQITADPRHKVEQALRQAGLHDTNYARQILASVKPLHPARPDQHSTLFKE
ncbi:LOW QUALITY PROTEIN: coiled-coil domain-containing protein 148-like [Dendronephthya gigantea]|uniref:LOW QUALITY PROTEIN: coiled-coil domain-containing protein 148-like n=1 Tax=Dendronephthya gigantea TaxID=151771 RepID=UPI00106C946D|nr:LOW QUALITY PROTEIN: coiled-coil domain-containing protein 148-like [Dendronephthya gigantea]